MSQNPYSAPDSEGSQPSDSPAQEEFVRPQTPTSARRPRRAARPWTRQPISLGSLRATERVEPRSDGRLQRIGELRTARRPIQRPAAVRSAAASRRRTDPTSARRAAGLRLRRRPQLPAHGPSDGQPPVVRAAAGYRSRTRATRSRAYGQQAAATSSRADRPVSLRSVRAAAGYAGSTGYRRRATASASSRAAAQQPGYPPRVPAAALASYQGQQPDVAERRAAVGDAQPHQHPVLRLRRSADRLPGVQGPQRFLKDQRPRRSTSRSCTRSLRSSARS